MLLCRSQTLGPVVTEGVVLARKVESTVPGGTAELISGARMTEKEEKQRAGADGAIRMQ